MRRLSMEIRDLGIDGSFGALPLAVEMFAARKHFWLWVHRAVISCAAYPTQALEPRSGHAKSFLQQS
jgi:hypothetical protein